MTTAENAYDDVVDLFAKGSCPKDIIQFRPSKAAQERASLLLARSKAGTLSDTEAAELDRMGHLEHLMQLVKARAHRYIVDQS